MSRRQQHPRQLGRLAPIAPRDGPPPPLATAEATSGAGEPSLKSPRARLPPRSRSGCWTCRTRKVKCDEGRPRCNQCTRLGHLCDYNPRLAFKDETSKIVEKYLGTSRPALKWDTSQKLPREDTSSGEVDTLPPFSSLTTEEDWEKKAGHRAPGTYYVIANSTSFPPSDESTPSASASKSPLTPSHSRRQSLYGGSADTLSDDGLVRRTANIVLSEDTLLLGSVEETSRQFQGLGSSTLTLQLDQGRASPGSPTPYTFLTDEGDLVVTPPVGLPYPIGKYSKHDLRRRHYRTVIRKHMFGINGHDDVPHPSQSDVFEQEAETFPLLATTLDELSAWSLAANGGLFTFDTQDRYLEILASLRECNSESDLRKDGKFLTHILLLVYEISASHRSWPLHLAALLHIFQIRGEELTSRFPSLIPWVLFIDCNALLCDTADGKVSDFIFENNMIPSDEDWLQSAMANALILPHNTADCSLALRAMKLLFVLLDHARRLGHLASRFRNAATALDSEESSIRKSQTSRWRTEIEAVRMVIESAWKNFLPELNSIVKDTAAFSEALATVCEVSWFLYHCLLIYSHTSMWPTQRLEEYDAVDEASVSQHCTTILERCHTVLMLRGEFSRRTLAFPLFLAGFASQDLGEKRHALDLLSLMEQASIGNNTNATRRWLHRLYGEQAIASESGILFAVDWVTKIKEHDFRIVHCGF